MAKTNLVMLSSKDKVFICEWCDKEIKKEETYVGWYDFELESSVKMHKKCYTEKLEDQGE